MDLLWQVPTLFMQIGCRLSKHTLPHYRFDPPLIPVRILKRYKRFLADIEGEGFEGITTVHCANPGGMQGLVEPKGEAWISDSQNPKRKLRYSLELLKLRSEAWVCVNTNLANRVIYEALKRDDLSFFPSQFSAYLFYFSLLHLSSERVVQMSIPSFFFGVAFGFSFVT